MQCLNDAVDYMLSDRGLAPRVAPPTRNRVDADSSLIVYHETGKTAKPQPQKTNFLPLRTHIITNLFSKISMAQTEAYYEEIDTIPARALGINSEFGAGHWYVIHPVTYWQVRDMSNRVLHDLKKWIEVDCPNELFTRKAKQVLAFRAMRDESLKEIHKELAKGEAKKGEIGEDSGCIEDWEIINENRECVSSGAIEVVEGKIGDSASGHTVAALEEAAEAGRRAAEEAKIRNEYDFMQ
ncbi:hypothetical protein GQ44DRAFT_735729 [Phaeosphaeriaceae sp. PMI808]|nr:hypothetical protein GQ44DRAFT_735729 [Phaeosphaeriaceae sp. PMI808]